MPTAAVARQQPQGVSGSLLDGNQQPVVCKPARNWKNVKGAIFFNPALGGPMTAPPGNMNNGGTNYALFEGFLRTNYNIAFTRSSEVRATIHKWPGVFVVRGLWDDADSVEGTLDAMRAAMAPKEIMFVRGGHVMTAWPESEIASLNQRMADFAEAIATGKERKSASIPISLRQAVEQAAPVWSEGARRQQ